MALKDYFPYSKSKERSPLTIGVKMSITNKRETHRISIIDKEGYSVGDNKPLEYKEAKKEEERVKKELVERGYSFID